MPRPNMSIEDDISSDGASDSVETDPIERRITALKKWIEEAAPEIVREQKHLDEGSRERAYWRYGYLVALQDIRNLIASSRRTIN